MTAPTTTRPRPDGPRPTPRRLRRRPTELTRDDAVVGVGSALAATATSWLIFTQLTQGVGWFGFLLITYLIFLAIFSMVTADRVGILVATDRLATVVISTGAVVLTVPLAWLVGYVVVKGLPALRLDFFLKDQRGVRPQDPATSGGGLHAIVGSLVQVGLACLVSVPLGVGVAVFLNETRSRLRRPVRVMIDAMSGLPSIVASLFIFAVIIVPYGKRAALFNYNGFMASLALAMIMLPTVARTVDVVIRLVPDGLREASLALGSSRARMVWSVVLPTARTGIATAVVLGIARIVGETAPLLFTAFGNDLQNLNPFANPQESLPLFVWRNVQKPSIAAVDRSFTGALVLLLVVLLLFAVARWVGRDRSGRRNRRRARSVSEPASTDLVPEEVS
jgi:phosphate transport system permease protein